MWSLMPGSCDEAQHDSILPDFANNRPTHKVGYVPIEKQPQCFSRWAVTVGDSLNEEIAVKDDARSKFGHRLFVPASLLADGLLGLLYEVVEFFFCYPTFIEALRDRLDDLLKRFLSENRSFKQFQSCGFTSSLALRSPQRWRELYQDCSF